MNIVHNIDNMAFMKDLPDNYYDLAICDPEYGIGADKKNNGKTSKSHEIKSLAKIKSYNGNWDSKPADEKYFTELKRVSKNQIIWGVNYYDYGLKGGRIYWKKNVTMPTYSSGELAYCSLINSIVEFEFTWHGMLQGNMKNKEVRIHPTQKPVALYRWLLQNYAKTGDKIFDSHVGSGSSRIACYELGFDFEGCELDKDYWTDQEDRFELEKARIDGKAIFSTGEGTLFEEIERKII